MLDTDKKSDNRRLLRLSLFCVGAAKTKIDDTLIITSLDRLGRNYDEISARSAAKQIGYSNGGYFIDLCCKSASSKEKVHVACGESIAINVEACYSIY